VLASAHSVRTPGEWVLDLLVSTRLNAGAHLDRPGLSDGDLAWLASGDRQCGGSDGIYQGQHPHPRGYGAFARLAEHYLAAGAATGYQRVARHLAANAADIYGLRKRGRLAPGMAADICVIGPGGITARAGYDDPREQAAGVSLVLVNGVITWRDGQPVTTPTPGNAQGTPRSRDRRERYRSSIAASVPPSSPRMEPICATESGRRAHSQASTAKPITSQTTATYGVHLRMPGGVGCTDP
jgi:N-acyl-D-amino-acid deacylase